jgi:hypothetical protein
MHQHLAGGVAAAYQPRILVDGFYRSDQVSRHFLALFEVGEHTRKDNGYHEEDTGDKRRNDRAYRDDFQVGIVEKGLGSKER